MFDQECTDARPWFEQWREREEFIKRFDELYSRRDKTRQFGNNKTKWINEAWILAQVARILKPSHLRWAEVESGPDAYVRIEEVDTPVEITAVYREGRRIAFEYQSTAPEGATRIEAVPKEEFDDEYLSRILHNRISEKTTKGHSQASFLLVYFDVGFNSEDDDGINQEIRRITNSRCEAFRGILVLWGSYVYGPRNLINNGCDHIQSL